MAKHRKKWAHPPASGASGVPQQSVPMWSGATGVWPGSAAANSCTPARPPQLPSVLVVYALPGLGEFAGSSLHEACARVEEQYPRSTVGPVWWPLRLLPPAWEALLGEGHRRPELTGWRPVLNPKPSGGTEMVAILIGRDGGEQI